MSDVDRAQPKRAVSINFRLTEEARTNVDAWAEFEDRNRSDMARVLIDEALAARAARWKRTHPVVP